MKKIIPISKGVKMEELLRNYFLKNGYYVIRGVPFVYEGFDITDIDLWLYNRASSVSREITIVDIKNKRTPQAIERIFWVQGLKKTVKADNAIVATTDNRPAVRMFGKDQGVVVLDGVFLQKLTKSESVSINSRLSDEEFFTAIDSCTLGKLDGDWKGRIEHSKGLLIKSLSFDSCNEWLIQGNFFAEQFLLLGAHRPVALRCLLLLCSFVVIAIDYCMRELVFQDFKERVRSLKEGFTYGSQGHGGVQKVLDITLRLVENYSSEGRAISGQIRQNIENHFSQLDTEILAEFFSKKEVSEKLFFIGKEFESVAMHKENIFLEKLSVDAKGLLYCFLDFWKLDRVAFSKAAR